MPLAIATALQFPIIIFQKQRNVSAMYVTPDIVTTQATAFVVYTHTGPGHYDAALPCHTFLRQNSSIAASTCSCDVNKTTFTRQTCIPNTIYATRCKCFLRSRPCSSQCRCVNYCNPNGIRPPPSKERTRKRRKHTFQVDIPDSKLFAEDRGEVLSEAIWSDFESIVLHEICCEIEEVSAISKVYNDIVYYSKTSYCLATLPHNVIFRNKRAAQIVSKREYSLSQDNQPS